MSSELAEWILEHLWIPIMILGILFWGVVFWVIIHFLRKWW